jgi:hypothetical protein
MLNAGVPVRIEWRGTKSEARMFGWRLESVLLTIPVAAICGLLPVHLFAESATNMMLNAALGSITSDELYEHVSVLADDVYEGRDAGSRGGRAAGTYIVNELRRYSLRPAGTNGDFFQPFNRNWRNILALVPGDDPELAREIIVVGAHYDHVGYGRRRNSYGPVGRIHNGADDNASGVSLLLEVIEAFDQSGLSTRRSVLFAFWDGEERGLLGSNHWLDQPTLPANDVKLAITIDMVGRLRQGQLHVYGTRTGFGLRRLVSGPVDDPLWLDFPWELEANSDHWPFFQNHVPIVMLHTGLHPDYHRPSDDVEKINRDGMREVGRYLLALVVKAANEDRLPTYRERGKHENNSTRRRLEQPLEPLALSRLPAGTPRPRLGISWREDLAEPGTVLVTRVVEGTPAAAAGIALRDRIYEINGQAFTDAGAFQAAILALLDGGAQEFSLFTERRGQLRTVTVTVPSSDAKVP